MYASLDDSYRSLNETRIKLFSGLWIYTNALVKQVSEHITEFSNFTMLTPFHPGRFSREHQTLLVEFLERETQGYNLVPCTHYYRNNAIKKLAHSFTNNKLKKDMLPIVRILYDRANYNANIESKRILEFMKEMHEIPEDVVVVQEPRSLERLLI